MTLDAAMRDALFNAARNVRARAHCPYSGFKVGAAVLDEQGRVHVGCNVENAAYPEGTCAEAGAIAAMVAAGGRRIEAILVMGDAPEPVTPCGGCRQKIREFADADTRLLAASPEAVQFDEPFSAFLPRSFGPGHL
ncbi:MAG: cytidine deaminase [Geminicoccaceae bacterium]